MDKRDFDDAIGEVPPSTVDVEAVIGRGRRADRLRVVANPAVAAGVAVVLLTGAVAYTMTDGGDGGMGVGTAPPTSTTSRTGEPTVPPSTGAPLPDGVTEVPPTMIDDGRDEQPPPRCEDDDLEKASVAAARLQVAATDAVLAQRPDLMLTPNHQYPPGTERAPLEFYQIVEPGEELPICHPQGRLESTATTSGPDGDGNLLMLVSPDLYPDQNLSCETLGLPGRTFCEETTGPHGEEIIKQIVQFDGGTIMHRVEVIRPDGTSLLVQAENVGTSSKYGGAATATAPPLTLDQLVEIGTAPKMTLFP